MNYNKLLASIKAHEGFSGVPYPDTEGKVTIGYGRNLTDNPLTKEEGVLLLEPLVQAAITSGPAIVTNYLVLTDARQNVLCEMIYNLGYTGVLGFHHMIEAIEAADYAAAAEHMLDSKWAAQVGKRALELAAMMKSGDFV